MANVKITQLPSAADTDMVDSTVIPIVSGDDGTTKQMSLETLKSGYLCDIQCASLAIASADVLQLNTTPLTIVPAQGASTVIEVLSAFVKLDYVSAAYATNTTLELIHSGAGLGIKRSSTALASTITNIMTFDTNVSPTSVNTQMVENVDLQIKVVTGDPTAGDSDIEIFVTYRVISI